MIDFSAVRIVEGKTETGIGKAEVYLDEMRLKGVISYNVHHEVGHAKQITLKMFVNDVTIVQEENG